MSKKVFTENTKALVTLIFEKPLSHRNASLQEAKKHLKKAVEDFWDI